MDLACCPVVLADPAVDGVKEILRRIPRFLHLAVLA